MSGLKLTIPTSFTDATLPILRDDPVLFAGSLALIEPAHAAAPLAGMPADGAFVPNIAHKEAAAALGVADDGLAAIFSMGAAFTGARGKMERTGKGGLHGIVSQAPGILQNSNHGAKVTLPANIRSYLLTNKAHKFYFSRWTRTTRAALANAGVQNEIGSGSNSAKFLLYRTDTAEGWNPSTALATAEYRPGVPNGLGNSFANLARVMSDTNLVATPANAGPQWGMPAGTFNNAVPAWVTQLPSSIFYRFYIEDLTVSGRSYAEVDSIDFAEYTKQVLTAGGRYYGDTFTDPATIA